jgi:hypothetical protein
MSWMLGRFKGLVYKMVRKINWFGFAAGVVILVLLVISFYVPWWQLTVGEDMMKVNASPVNTNFGVFGTQFTVPLIWALNLVSILTLAVSGVAMLLYSFFPTKSYSKELLGFSYKKPLYTLILFVSGLLVIISIAGVLGFSIPLLGSTTFAIPTQFVPTGLSINALVSGSFQLPFYFAIGAVALCIAARLYHGRVVKIPETKPATAIPPTENQAIN